MKLFLSSQNWGFRPNIGVILGGKATKKNTDRLLKTIPVVFCELSGTSFLFLRSPNVVYFSRAANQFSLKAQQEGCWTELRPEILDLGGYTGARNTGSWRISYQNHHVLITGNEKVLEEALGKLRGAS